MCVCVACTRQLDVVIILDLSGSIEEVQRYDAMVALARAVSVGLPVASGRARVGAITYDSMAADQFYLSTYDRDVQGLLNAFEFNHARGSTNTQAALDLAFTSQVRLALCLSLCLSVTREVPPGPRLHIAV